MNTEHIIISQVYTAKSDQKAADHLIRQYLPFIKSETSRFINRPPMEGVDDELSIALFAFHEAILNYSKTKGAFLRFAALNIRNRLIDYSRKEQRHQKVLSLDFSDQEKDDVQPLSRQLSTGKDEIEEHHIRSATREELLHFADQLSDFGLSLTDITDNCPRQKRTLTACHAALNYAKTHPELLESFLESKRIPVAKLAAGSGVERKTLERHRKYMVALLLAYTNGFEIIRSHLCQIVPISTPEKP
ncbi:MAG: sigma factor [Lachnospiraceae bacterium]|nr:sigma factor [Lachnospiraceae bacterium]